MEVTPALPVLFSDVLGAADILSGRAHRTPVMTSRQLDALADASLFLKCENLQRTGAFKFRGACNALSRLTDAERERGVLTYSSGNHAQAIALAGSLLGIRTTIIMPSDAPAVKIAATKGYGADIVTYDKTVTTREDLAAELQSASGATLIPPYDHPHVVAGQGTVGLELLQAIPHLDYLFVCCGGGGLLSGCAIAARSLAPECKVVGVEPEAGDDATRSFYTGTLQSVHNPDTIADGARTPYLGKITFPLIQAHVDDMITVSDSQLVDGMRFLWERMKLVVEPTGVLALAGALSGKMEIRGKKVGIVISGGNVDLARACELFSS
ncbi:MAG: threo-3-hydroxy-L-aspartate ammonia-lyase [Rhodothermales bacterium]